MYKDQNSMRSQIIYIEEISNSLYVYTNDMNQTTSSLSVCGDKNSTLEDIDYKKIK